MLGLGYIGFDAWQTKGELTRVEASARQLKTQLDRARRAHVATEEILAENADLEALARELYAMAGAVGVMAMILAFDYRHIERFALAIYVGVVGLLAATLVLAPVTRGAPGSPVANVRTTARTRARSDGDSRKPGAIGAPVSSR